MPMAEMDSGLRREDEQGRTAPNHLNASEHQFCPTISANREDLTMPTEFVMRS